MINIMISCILEELRVLLEYVVLWQLMIKLRRHIFCKSKVLFEYVVLKVIHD